MSRQTWKTKRSGQGRSYDEVIAEIKRRADGNYLFSSKENAVRLQKAYRDAALVFKLSANLHDFFETEQLDLATSLCIFGDSAIEDAMGVMLDPFPVGQKDHEIKTDSLIDLLYPGVDFDVERGITLVHIRKKKE